MAEFNSDELEAPQWLNAEFFTKFLYQCENNEEIILDTFKLTPGTAKGDHFASIMFRAVLSYHKLGEAHNKSIIIKTMPEVEGVKMDMIKNLPIFETEIGMYSEVIPKFEQILREVGDNTKLGPACLYYSVTPRNVIIFEDIVPHGYAVIRKRLADMTETKAALLKLAKWHAISYKLNLENPTYFDKYRHGSMTSDALTEMEFMKTGITLFIEMLDSIPTLQKYKPYFEKLEPDLIKNCKAIFHEFQKNPQPNSYYVLCHGDFHFRNMMFKNDADTGKLLDVMLLDFQVCYMGPMVNDLSYSFYLLVDADLRANHFDEILYFYFTNFVETLKKIGFEGDLPKLIDFRKQLLHYRYWNIFLLTTFLPMSYISLDGTADADELMGSDDRKNFYQDKRYHKDLHIILPKLLHLGYLEK